MLFVVRCNELLSLAAVHIDGVSSGALGVSVASFAWQYSLGPCKLENKSAEQ